MYVETYETLKQKKKFFVFQQCVLLYVYHLRLCAVSVGFPVDAFLKALFLYILLWV